MHPFTAGGAVCFLISDFPISVTTFVVPTTSRWARAAVQASYLVGQFLIMCGILIRPDGAASLLRTGTTGLG
jgi:uncharacterized membrane protein YhhN